MTAAPETDWNGFAYDRLSKVLGEDRARATMAVALEKSGLRALESVGDLYRFAQQLTAMSGFERAVGGMLSLQAVLRGARPEN